MMMMMIMIVIIITLNRYETKIGNEKFFKLINNHEYSILYIKEQIKIKKFNYHLI